MMSATSAARPRVEAKTFNISMNPPDLVSEENKQVQTSVMLKKKAGSASGCSFSTTSRKVSQSLALARRSTTAAGRDSQPGHASSRTSLESCYALWHFKFKGTVASFVLC